MRARWEAASAKMRGLFPIHPRATSSAAAATSSFFRSLRGGKHAGISRES